ncbi:MAG: zinc-ribbon domain-containing protein [Candidatus Glassbacteria bacterium]|nr:zinc-ribbon domain-containing protein [Candidatus Glassbacteria bacterium]
MIIVCHNCSARYKIKDELVADGPKRTKCKNCGAVMLIASPSGGAAPDQEVLTRDGGAPAPGGHPRARQEQPATQSPPAAETADSGTGAPEASRESTGTAAEEPPAGEPGTGTPAAGDRAEEAGERPAGAGGEKAEETRPEEPDGKKEKKPEDEDPLAKMEKRRQRMEDEISGRLHKAALETLDFKDLELLAKKINKIEDDPNYKAEEEEQIFCCIACNSVYSLFPDDPRTCSNCPGEAPLIRGADIIRQYSMFRRV